MTKLMRAVPLLVFLVSLGCGSGADMPPMAPVKGKVTLYGKPHKKGIVTYEPQGGGPSGSSLTDENGDYEIWTSGFKGAVIGNHTVRVTTVVEASTAPPPSEMSSDDPNYAAQALGGPAAYKQSEKNKEPVPAKYNKNSELKFEVKSGSNTNNLDLK